MTNKDEYDIQLIQLEEWRRKIDSIERSYDRIRSRSVTLLTVQVGLVGYFLSQYQLLIEPGMVSKIFFIIGAILGLHAIQLALRNYRTYSNWLSPMYDLETEKMNNAENKRRALKVLLDDYKDAYDNNHTVNELTGKRLTYSLFFTIASAIILLVLNFT